MSELLHRLRFLSDDELDAIARRAGVSRGTVSTVLFLERARWALFRLLSAEVKRLLLRASLRNGRARETVYFVQAEARGLIKIGTTADLNRRLRALRAGSPLKLRLIGVIPGGRRLERLLHLAFAPLRRGRTEWFEPGESLVSFIRDLQPVGRPAR